MNLDSMAVALRPRSGWQSIDLGFKLARQWFVPLFTLWCVLSVPVYVLCKLAGLPSWTVLLVWWWFKPLYEAPLYHWCSRAVFSEPVTLRQSLAVVPRKLWPLLSTYLLFWRLGTARSQNMNVIVVENTKGKARAARIRVISRVTKRTDALIFVCLHIEAAIAYSLMLIGFVLLPGAITDDAFWALLTGNASTFWLTTAFEVSALIAAGVVAPFYVCSGFSLYINRRTHLEAWDIDLHFRRMVERHQQRRQFTPLDQATAATHGEPVTRSDNKGRGMPPSIAAGLLVLALSFGLLQPDASVATTIPDDKTSHTLINGILEHEDFGVTLTKTNWQFKEVEEEEDEDLSELDWEWEWLGRLVEFFRGVTDVASWIEGLLWLVALSCLAALVIALVRGRHHLAGVKEFLGFRRHGAASVQVQQLDITPESLPSDIPAKAHALLDKGQHREAMSLLYRGALSRLVHRYGMQISASATEQQCVDQVVRQQPSARGDAFATLTRHWLRTAYGRNGADSTGDGGVNPDPIRTLCDTWARAFDSSAFDSSVLDANAAISNRRSAAVDGAS